MEEWQKYESIDLLWQFTASTSCMSGIWRIKRAVQWFNLCFRFPASWWLEASM